MSYSREDIKQQIDEVIGLCKQEASKPGSFGYLPDIIRVFERMSEHLDISVSADQRAKDVGGLGRVVTEDYTFSASPLAARIMDVASQYVNLTNS